jgi:hypothetical protein
VALVVRGEQEVPLGGGGTAGDVTGDSNGSRRRRGESPAKTASPPPYGAPTRFQKYLFVATRGRGKCVATATEEMGEKVPRRRDLERCRRRGRKPSFVRCSCCDMEVVFVFSYASGLVGKEILSQILAGIICPVPRELLY